MNRWSVFRLEPDARTVAAMASYRGPWCATRQRSDGSFELLRFATYFDALAYAQNRATEEAA